MKKDMAIGCGIDFGTSSLLVVIAVVCFMMWFSDMIDDSLSKTKF